MVPSLACASRSRERSADRDAEAFSSAFADDLFSRSNASTRSSSDLDSALARTIFFVVGGGRGGGTTRCDDRKHVSDLLGTMSL